VGDQAYFAGRGERAEPDWLVVDQPGAVFVGGASAFDAGEYDIIGHGASGGGVKARYGRPVGVFDREPQPFVVVAGYAREDSNPLVRVSPRCWGVSARAYGRADEMEYATCEVGMNLSESCDRVLGAAEDLTHWQNPGHLVNRRRQLWGPCTR
jgi:hypothetical protein